MHGKVIMKGPKVGRLLQIQFIFGHLSLACKNVLNSCENWQIKLGHINFVVLNKNVVSNASISCSICKLAKSKTIPFPFGVYRASTCFEMTHIDVWDISCSFSCSL